jgi:cell division protein FtsZ
MNSENHDQTAAPAGAANCRVKIFGVGTAGLALAATMRAEGFAGAQFIGVNTSAVSAAEFSETVILETKTLRGFGSGGDPERARRMAEEQFVRLQTACADADVVFLLAGLGGGTGSGVAPVLARAARETGALVLGFVSLPFECEGNRRQQIAQQALEHLQAGCDGVLCLPNQKAMPLLPENVSFLDTFRATSEWLIGGARGIWRLLQQRALIEIHFDELSAVLCERQGVSAFATVEAAGPNRGTELLEKIAVHPLLENGKSLETAATVLVSLAGGAGLSFVEVDRLMQALNTRCGQARVIMGAAVDESFGDKLMVTIIASRFRKTDVAATSPAEDESVTTTSGLDFGAELLHPTKAERPASRTSPPVPALSLEQRDEIIAKQGGKSGRGRKNPGGARMRQTTLPLDIVNKGRFDKSEPTIHKGEDLDLPTYVRRGVALN